MAGGEHRGRGPLVHDHVDVDLWDPATFAAGMPDDAFAVLRRDAPVAWHPEKPRREGGHSGPGFWCITTHADIQTVSMKPEVFSSWLGGFTGADIGGAVLDETRLNLMGMDPPDHSAFRRSIRAPFGPSVTRDLGQVVQGFATSVIDAVAPLGEVDFVETIASELPLLTLSHLLGVAAEDRHLFYDWSNRIIGNHDPEFGGSVRDFLTAKDELFAYGRQVISEKRATPDSGLISTFIHSEVDGVPLDDEKLILLWFLLLIAGNETTRSSLTGAMEMLTAHPAQRRWLVEDLDERLPGFIEESLRLSNPVIHFRRTATTDVELNGAQIREGDKVILWYPSANRDADVFDRPDDFDPTRSPNHHVAFGFGPHFCLGARVGRLQIEVMLRELLTRLPDIDVVVPARRAHSTFLNSPKSLGVRFTPEAGNTR
jgi:cytochrome P450